MKLKLLHLAEEKQASSRVTPTAGVPIVAVSMSLTSNGIDTNKAYDIPPVFPVFASVGRIEMTHRLA